MQRDRPSDFPTVLVAANDRGTGLAFTARLEQEHCLVLAARNANEALQFVISHSRPIHVLLIDLEMDGIEVAARLGRYRPDMQVVLFSEERDNTPHALPPEEALLKVRLLLGMDPVGNTGTAVPIRRTSKEPELHEVRQITPRIA